MSRMTAAMAASSRSATPITAAIASRVTSSCVGPRPPEMMTASASAKRWRNTASMRPTLSPILTWLNELTPLRASCSPIHAELVSTIWPSSSSVPTAITSQRMDPLRLGGASAPEVLRPADDREHDGDPQRPVRQPAEVDRGEWQQGEADGELLGEGLVLRQLARRDAH